MAGYGLRVVPEPTSSPFVRRDALSISRSLLSFFCLSLASSHTASTNESHTSFRCRFRLNSGLYRETNLGQCSCRRSYVLGIHTRNPRERGSERRNVASVVGSTLPPCVIYACCAAHGNIDYSLDGLTHLPSLAASLGSILSILQNER